MRVADLNFMGSFWWKGTSEWADERSCIQLRSFSQLPPFDKREDCPLVILTSEKAYSDAQESASALIGRIVFSQ